MKIDIDIPLLEKQVEVLSKMQLELKLGDDQYEERWDALEGVINLCCAILVARDRVNRETN